MCCQLIIAERPGNNNGADNRQRPGVKSGQQMLRRKTIRRQHNVTGTQGAVPCRQHMRRSIITPFNNLTLWMQESTLLFGGGSQPAQVTQWVQAKRGLQCARAVQFRKIKVLFAKLLASQHRGSQPEQPNPVFGVVRYFLEGLARARHFELGITLDRRINIFVANDLTHQLNRVHLRLIIFAGLVNAVIANHVVDVE